ncbi:hypothetical protein [Jeotgalibacillus sp. R-1-5s-1]|uniref:hypothetical protein n=1 Tax=Jeotgalibacillus sp. R-1-5s-1 TaxID=2555897 RepID=UPI0010693A29|nr:hypothetical protein [Jeotgalibacillus sp. R-1-5s-1]TFD97057.1 hypothetical protein E2491_10210 [Jeotgalibacillus sp. R-1-5s-1]
MKKYVLLMTAALALAACSDDQAQPKEKKVVEAAEVEEVKENNKAAGSVENTNNTEETNIDVSEEVENTVGNEAPLEWHAEWTNDQTIVIEELVDFNQDGTDEMVIGTATHLLVGAQTGNEWEAVYVEEAEVTGFSGVMENESVGQMAAVTTVYEGKQEAGADTLRLLRYTENDGEFGIIEAYRFEGIDAALKNADFQVTTNTLDIIMEDPNAGHRSYLLEGEQLVNMDYDLNLFDGEPLTNDPAFQALFPEFFSTGIVMGDSIDTVIQKAGEGQKGGFYGSSALHYDGFTVLYRDDTRVVQNLLLTGNGELTVEDLRKATGKEMEIYHYETGISGTVYHTPLYFDQIAYSIEYFDMDGELTYVYVK